MNANEVIQPGSWLGVLGGGQLGRMFAHAAQSLGYHVAVYEPSQEAPAAQAADRHFGAGSEALQAMGELCDVVTLEFENIDAESLLQAGRFSPTHPGAHFLQMCQNRLKEKSSLAEAGFPVTPFQEVQTIEEATAAAESLGWPLVLKTATSGYDGKGQTIVKSAEQLQEVWEEYADCKTIAEKWIEFDAEVSMVTARNLRGQIQSYPLFENSHVDHILDLTRCPVSNPLRELESRAREISRGIAESFGVIGLFCVEFFVGTDGELMINEIAPRPHNSGHLTIEAFTVSQFEQQVRSICNLPLLPAQQIRPAAMANLLGDLWEAGEPNWEPVFAQTDAHLHLYGKVEARVGRKMGHLTVLDDSSSEAALTARELRDEVIASE